MTKVRITWNGTGGKLDAVTVKDDGDGAVREALIRLVRGQIVSPGDTFVVEKLADARMTA